MAVDNRAVGQHGIRFERVQRHAAAEVGVTLAGFGVVSDFVRAQFVFHFIERNRQAVAIVTGKNMRGQTDLPEIVDRVNAHGPAFGGGQGRQQHGGKHGKDGYHDQQNDDAVPAAPDR